MFVKKTKGSLKVFEKHKSFSEKRSKNCSQVKRFLLENSFRCLVNMILIKNLRRGKTGKDSWVQVMAMQTGSAWKLENSQFDLLCCQANAKGLYVYKICWTAYPPRRRNPRGVRFFKTKFINLFPHFHFLGAKRFLRLLFVSKFCLSYRNHHVNRTQVVETCCEINKCKNLLSICNFAKKRSEKLKEHA